MSENEKQKLVLALSGGLDSATALALALENIHDYHVVPVWFEYGSKHNEYERDATAEILAQYDITHSDRVGSLQVIDLSEFMAGFSSALLKTGDEIPEGHYDDESMEATVVPARNLIFMSVLAGIAASLPFKEGFKNVIAIGIHQGDHAIYPDCRPDFFASAQQTVQFATDQKVVAWAPLLDMDKVGVVAEALRLGVPTELTRTCYKDQEKPCGKCGSCDERLAAFKANKVTDPVEYATETYEGDPE